MASLTCGIEKTKLKQTRTYRKQTSGYQSWEGMGSGMGEIGEGD